MATTLTLKNIPDEIYTRLRASADTNRRSLNGEALVCLETVLLPERIQPHERLIRARALRAMITKARGGAREIDTMKRKGRR